jgi:hypothetical protein
MPPELFETALGSLQLAVLFVVALFLPLLLQLLLLFSFGWFFKILVYQVSPFMGRLLGTIGVPLHEFAHAIGDLITLSGVAAIKPLIDDLGYAFVQSRRTNFVGRIVASLAPLFGGTLVLWLTALYVIPGFDAPAISFPQLDLESATSFETVLGESMDYLGRFLRTAYNMLPAFEWGNWRTWMGFYIAISVGLGIAPSGQDLKVMLSGLPLAVLLILGLFTWLHVSGDAEVQFLALQEGLVPRLLKFSTAVTYAFTLTVLGVLVFLPMRLWQWLRQA